MQNKLSEMLRMASANEKAGEYTGQTVESLNDDFLLESYEFLLKDQEFYTFGVKNTRGIGKKYINKLLNSGKFLWHTIDKMSYKGRAADVDLINPLTGRIMTGSSSASAINVLMGINDIGIGTDGGGSVLAPAISLNLFAIMAKGMGLKGNDEKVSTDGISFTPGIGVMSHSYKMAKNCIETMLNIYSKKEIKVGKAAVPEYGTFILPNGKDARLYLEDTIVILRKLGFEIFDEIFPDFKDRKDSIDKLKRLMDKYQILITCEGPIDLYGFGDSVFGCMGESAKSIQDKSGKYMLKVANMVNATAVCMPVQEVSTGLLFMTSQGMEEGLELLSIAEKLAGINKIPELYYSYFKDDYLKYKNPYMFSKEE